jgi:hypothetical protein
MKTNGQLGFGEEPKGGGSEEPTRLRGGEESGEAVNAGDCSQTDELEDLVSEIAILRNNIARVHGMTFGQKSHAAYYTLLDRYRERVIRLTFLSSHRVFKARSKTQEVVDKLHSRTALDVIAEGVSLDSEVLQMLLNYDLLDVYDTALSTTEDLRRSA